MKIDVILRRKANRIIAIGMGGTVERALQILKAENVGALIVKDTCGTEGDVVLGILSERDIARALADNGAATLQMPVSRLMARNVVDCHPDDDAAHVIGLMQKHHIRHVPVREREALLGVISIRDVLGLATAMPDRAGPQAHAEAVPAV
jgi:CBS domain-containing protein